MSYNRDGRFGGHQDQHRENTGSYDYQQGPDQEHQYNQYNQYEDPFENPVMDYPRNGSSERLQQPEQSHARDSISPQRRRPSEYELGYLNSNHEYTGGYHQTSQTPFQDQNDYQYDQRYYNTPIIDDHQVPTQYSPIQGPTYSQREFIPMAPNAPFDENYYRNDSSDASVFNSFPVDPDTSYHGAAPGYLNDPYSVQSLPDKFQTDEELNLPRHFPDEELALNKIEQPPTPEEGSETGDYDVPEESSRRKIEVRLLNGHLILDCPVPDRILDRYNLTESDDARELRYMRYQAVTCDPRDFMVKNFSLRQRFYRRPRDIEILIVVTIYNEQDVLLARTLKGIFDNIQHLESKKNSSTWGPDSWKKIVVCIVADGREKIHETSQALLAGLGVYQEGFARNAVNDEKVVSHVFEYTSMIGISKVDSDRVKLKLNATPVQLLFCLKEENQKKINSHRWALEAFGQTLNPETVVLLDAGTQPSKDSIYHLWKEFKNDPQVAGTCGEIKAMLGKNYQKLLNPLVAAQNFEYKMSNILDKPMESSFGFISVLPGAFSAYRYSALLGEPLMRYFEGETMHDSNSGVFKSNMYLAEDRILCFELVAKQNCSWLLRYCRSASAETDVPEEVHDFVSQRRRWLNGSFFAAIYSVFHFHKIMTSSHSFGRKFALCVEFVYQFLSLLVSWFSLGSYFLVFRILTTSLGDLYNPCKYLSVVFLWLYLLSVVTTFILSFGNTPRGTPKFYLVIIIFFAVLMAYMVAAAIIMAVHSINEILASGPITAKLLFTNRTFRDLIISTLTTYALYLIASIIHLKPMHMLTSFLQYLLLSPSYVNVLNIYAFCNLHDISWGTKGATAMTLGDAQISEDGEKVQFVDAPITAEEINDLYEKQMDILAHTPRPKPAITPESLKVDEQKRKEKEEEDKKNYYAFIRSMVVLTWITTNFIIIALVLETGGMNQLADDPDTDTSDNRSQVFLTVILWIVAFMAAFRLIGTVYYIVRRLVK